MGLLSYIQIEDGWAGSANLWNERFGKIYDEFNGNIEAVNLKNGAVTTPKLADGAVTAAKLDTQLSIDDNGWTVLNLGGVKSYTRSIPVISKTIGGSGTRAELGRVPAPIGRTIDNVALVATYMGGYSGHIVVNSEKSGGEIAISGGNIWPSALTFDGQVFVQVTEII